METQNQYNHVFVGADAHIGPQHDVTNSPETQEKTGLFSARGDVGIAPYAESAFFISVSS